MNLLYRTWDEIIKSYDQINYKKLQSTTRNIRTPIVIILQVVDSNLFLVCLIAVLDNFSLKFYRTDTSRCCSWYDNLESHCHASENPTCNMNLFMLILKNTSKFCSNIYSWDADLRLLIFLINWDITLSYKIIKLDVFFKQ